MRRSLDNTLPQEVDILDYKHLCEVANIDCEEKEFLAKYILRAHISKLGISHNA